MLRLFSFVLLFTSLVTTFGSPKFSCPDDEFLCVSSQSCISAKWECDGENDCSDGADEHCDTVITCRPGYFKCNSGRCIESSWICDGHADCPGKDDEAPIQICNQTTCKPSDFQCRNGDCIQGNFKCDHEDDCEDGSDEVGCPALVCSPSQYKCAHNRTCISNLLKCNGINDCIDASDEKDCSSCSANKFQCTNNECVPVAWRCDRDSDCEDHSDEQGCPPQPTSLPCLENKFQCGDRTCIPKRWKCDGETDCTDKTDEQGCPTVITCSSSEFTCTSGKCIPRNFKCNGSPDCPDGSDEAGCGSTSSPCGANKFHCSTTSVCIDMDKVCNNIRDCPDGDDESLSCNINECTDHNGHCHHNCIDLIIGYKCSCNTGYKLGNDSRACEDINECEVKYGICSQTCVNNKGSYKCGCVDGYVEEMNINMCKADGPSPYIIFGDDHSLRNLSISGTQYNILASNRKSPTAVDYHLDSGYIYWTDVLDEKIARAQLLGDGKVENVVNNVKHSNGLAVDWVGKNLYWTDESTKSIEVSQLSGKNRLKLFSISHGDPRGIAVDPFERLLFWTDWVNSRPKIEQASMDGNSVSRLVILDTDIIWPTALTLDTILQRIYFADSKLQKIETCKYDGSSRMKLIPSGVLHPLSLAVFEDYLYYTDYSLGTIFSVNKLNGHVYGLLINKLQRPTGIAVVHPLSQKKVATKCSENNGGCSHLCLLSTNVNKYSCRCPDGMHLHRDGKSCRTIAVINETTSTLREPTEKQTTTCKTCGVTHSPTTAKKNGTLTPLVKKYAGSSSPKHGPLIAGVTVALVVLIFLVLAVILYVKKRSNFRARTILFYKDNSRVPLQNDFDEDPLKTQEDVGSRSRVQFA